MTAWERFADQEVVQGSAGDVFALVRSGRASSRSAIARELGLAPSTVSIRVDALENLGLLTEGGVLESAGGRRARRLEVAREVGAVAAVDVGAHHATLTLADLGGTELSSTRLAHPAGRFPEEFADSLWAEVDAALVRTRRASSALRAIAIGIPAPVAFPSGRLVTPSFMPTWHDADLVALLGAYTDVPVLIENDANLLALAESAQPARSPVDHLLAVKLGSRIGCGVIASGRLHRGVSGAAGEISHTPVNGESTIPCTCGVLNCLESVASGGAVIELLRRSGYAVASTADLVALSRAGDPGVTGAIREAGARIGTVLSGIVNFLNPREVVLGGTMSASPPLVAAIRAELFQRCLPLVADDLEVRAVRDATTGAIRGAVHLALEEALAPARINAAARSLDEEARPA